MQHSVVPSGGSSTEWFLPLPAARDQIRDAQRFRSTWLTASQSTLRERGYWERYEAALDPTHRKELLELVAGRWLPIEVAHAHYAAADRIGIPPEELVTIGAAATRRANATTFRFITRMAQGAGATPWTLLGYAPRIWATTCDGGAIGIARLGPKEARIEIIGYPMANLAYNRVTMRGIVTAGVELFCKRTYVREVASLCDDRCLGMIAAWV